jgi:hypothetical protein
MKGFQVSAGLKSRRPVIAREQRSPTIWGSHVISVQRNGNVYHVDTSAARSKTETIVPL